jgi:hypothetical protein
MPSAARIRTADNVACRPLVMETPRKPNLARLMQPVPWRPALQIGDAGYQIPKSALRALILTAQRGQAEPR